jgi:hypothetical protein
MLRNVKEAFTPATLPRLSHQNTYRSPLERIGRRVGVSSAGNTR